MSRLGFYYNAAMCSGCRACQVACKDRADLPVGALYRKVRSYETGTYPTPAMYHYSHTCNHCEKPECVANCPTGAMNIADDGTVQHDDEKCIGCETCVKSCPYGVPVYLDGPGIVGKCDSCKPLRDLGMNPVCVDACCMRALDFGDLGDLESKYGPDLVKEIAPLPSADTTNPSTLLTVKQAMLEEDFREVVI